MPDQGPTEFFNKTLNMANANLEQIVEGTRDTPNLDVALKAAEIQVEMAKAVGLVMIAQAIQATSTPGQSIRYGMEPLTNAVQALADNAGPTQ